MQMRHSLIPDVLPIMPIMRVYLFVKRSDRLTFYSYFKKRVGQTNNYIGSCVYPPHNQSYTPKNIAYVSPYPQLGEHLLKLVYLRVGRSNRLTFFPTSRGEVDKQIVTFGSCVYLLHSQSHMLKNIGGQNSRIWGKTTDILLHVALVVREVDT